MNMTWEGIIKLSLSKKRPKKLISRHKGCWLLVIEPVHCGSNKILKVHILVHDLHLNAVRTGQIFNDISKEEHIEIS